MPENTFSILLLREANRVTCTYAMPNVYIARYHCTTSRFHLARLYFLSRLGLIPSAGWNISLDIALLCFAFYIYLLLFLTFHFIAL